MEQKILDLDAHLYLLRKHLDGLRESPSHIKAVAAQLRVLLCRSSGTDGLLYRLIGELGVDDSVSLHVPGDFDLEHPLARDLTFAFAPIWRAGQGPPEIPPYDHSFRGVIRQSQALLAAGKPLTHEYLIKAIAQQMGSAHEDEGVDPALAQLQSILVNGEEPFVEVLAMDGKLTLEVGERVLEEAERRGILQRPRHDHDYGNVTIVARVRIKGGLQAPIRLYRFHSYGPQATVTWEYVASGVNFLIEKRTTLVREIWMPYPEGFNWGDDPLFAFSYSSRTGQARVVTSEGPSDAYECPIGWVHAGDMEIAVEQDLHDQLEPGFLLTYSRLLSTQDVIQLQALPPDGRGLWLPREELASRGPFPD